MTDSTLWPILLVIIGHAVALGAPVLLLALRDGRTSARVVTGLFVVLTGLVLRSDVKRRGRPAALSAIAFITWLLSVVAAVVADRHGLF